MGDWNNLVRLVQKGAEFELTGVVKDPPSLADFSPEGLYFGVETSNLSCGEESASIRSAKPYRVFLPATLGSLSVWGARLQKGTVLHLRGVGNTMTLSDPRGEPRASTVLRLSQITPISRLDLAFTPSRIPLAPRPKTL